jgi:large subunit ribosomal protein L25
MADKIVVTAAPRDSRGKNEARRLRTGGQIPAVLYGAKGDAITLAVSAKQVGQILRSATGHNTLFQGLAGGSGNGQLAPR